MKINKDSIYNIAEQANKTNLMRRALTHLSSDPDMAFVILSLVASFIDGLAKGPQGRTRQNYLQYLKMHFPDLCSALGAEVFYSHFRCTAIHEFAPRPPFALGRSNNLKDEYTGAFELDNTKWSSLNVDRLLKDFMQHLDAIDKAETEKAA